MTAILMTLFGGGVAVVLGVAGIVFGSADIDSAVWTPEERARFIGPER